MAGIEKLKRIEELLENGKKHLGLKYWEADEIRELMKNLKVSDLFLFLGEDECSYDTFFKYFPNDIGSREGRRNSKLEAAIDGGYVKMYDYRSYGRYHYRIKLTAKGRKLIEKAKTA